jgi:galactose mutarotase-like enzyme
MFDPVTIGAGDVAIEVVPARGALVTALRVRGTEVLYLDKATLADPAKNVRGGIPLLFPFAGKLDNDWFALTGTSMKQHGFARNRSWAVTASGASWLRMSLAADADTHAQYPYAFTADHSVLALPNGVQLELTIAAGAAPLPVSPGWHPYFACAAANKPALRSDLAGFPADGLPDDREPDFGMVAPALGRARLDVPGLGALRLTFSPELRHLQCWSQPGKPFVCLEPFFGPAGTINTERRAWVPAGEARTFWMRLELD